MILLALHQSELADVQLKEGMSSDGVKLTRAKIVHLNSYQGQALSHTVKIVYCLVSRQCGQLNLCVKVYIPNVLTYCAFVCSFVSPIQCPVLCEIVPSSNTLLYASSNCNDEQFITLYCNTASASSCITLSWRTFSGELGAYTLLLFLAIALSNSYESI